MNSKIENPRTEWLLNRSKLEQPSLPGRLVKRPRLVERLEEDRACRVTLIAAPAGYGKTTLALQWLADHPGATVWISLSRRDSEPELFASYLVAALRGRCPGALARSAALLEAREAPPWEHFCEVLLSELSALETPVAVVLDDYHTITSGEVHELVVRMVEEVPERLRVMALGRKDPAWPLGRWRGKGWLNELRARDLRFSRDEIRQFLTDFDGPSLEAAEIDTLGALTEGWAAGLQLARISVAQASDPNERARRFSGDDRLVVDYLVSEVLANQPPEILALLEVTAPLERFCAPLCAHLLEERCPDGDAAELLARLERDQLFLVPLDAGHGWFRYHHLFRQLLLQRLPELASSDRRARISAWAAEWFAGEGLAEEAIRLWIDAGDLDEAAGLLGRCLHSVIDEDFSRWLLKRWLALFPPGAAEDRLSLLVAQGYLGVVRWDLGGIADLVSRARVCLRRNDVDRTLTADIEALGAFLSYWQGDAANARRHADRALEVLGESDGGIARSMALVYRAGALARMGRYLEARGFLGEAIRDDLSRGSRRAGELLHVLAMLDLYHGELDAVEETARKMTGGDETTPIPVYFRAYGSYFLGVVALERDSPAEAEERFREVDESRHLTNTRLSTDALVGLALVAERRADRKAMASWVSEARAFAVETRNRTSLEVVESLEARLAGLTGNGTRPSFRVPTDLDAISCWLEVPALTHAETLLRHAEAETRRMALPSVEEQLARVKEVHNHRHLVRLLVMRAEGLAEAGRWEEALEVLEDALRRAERQQMVRPFLGGGPLRPELLQSLAVRIGRGPFLERVCRVVSANDSAHGGRAAVDDISTSKAAGIACTAREIETLELLARRLTNKEIAARLSVTSAAVKKRLESIYAKLDVHGRREAVAAAVALGIIRTPPR